MPLSIEARVRTSALGTSDTALVSVRGVGGEAASVRVTDRGVLAWFDGATKIRSVTPLRPNTWYRITLTLDQAARSSALRVRTDGGTAVDGRRSLGWRMPAVQVVRSVCFETAGASLAQTIDLAEVQVIQPARP